MAGLTPEDSIFGKKAETTSQSSLKGEVGSSPLYPQCGSSKAWRDGQRKTLFGDYIQRWLCRKCNLRFSDPQQQKEVSGFLAALELKSGVTKSIKSKADKLLNCQIRVTETKNLGPEQTAIQQVPGRIEDTKGKLVQFAWHMRQEGYNPETIRSDSSCLRGLIIRGADLTNPESVKEALAKEQKWSQSRRSNAINAYTLFLKFQGLTWNRPRCQVTRKFPFIPSEQEIDALIAGSGKKNAALLQTLKETGMRSGEAKRLQWIDIDREKNIITLNDPEKNSNPRMWKGSTTLIEMLNALAKENESVFAGSLKSMKTTFMKTRRRLAQTLQNPRLLRVHFHTLRHWKATMLYHQTKDPYYVQRFLGHKSLKSTEIYINIEHTLFEAGANEQFTVRVVEKPEEIKELLEVGFEYVCQKDMLIFLRKRK